MERLTMRRSLDGNHALECLCLLGDDGKTDVIENCSAYCNCRFSCGNCGIQKAFNLLAAYEDTGLTPEEIKHLQENKGEIGEALDGILAKLKEMIGEDGESNA